MDPIEAAYLALATEHGLLDPSVAVDRACELVIADPNPDAQLLELAGSVRPHPLDVSRLLRRLAVGADSAAVFRRLAAFLRKLLAENPEAFSQVTLVLEHLAIGGAVPEPASSECRGFDDSRLLAEAGTYGTIDQVRRDVIAFLDDHGVYAE